MVGFLVIDSPPQSRRRLSRRGDECPILQRFQIDLHIRQRASQPGSRQRDRRRQIRLHIGIRNRGQHLGDARDLSHPLGHAQWNACRLLERGINSGIAILLLDSFAAL